ncbi:MAG: hypothetical protein HOH58_03435 [Opitutaceae bacterium]|jgi:hypothetical protein|nr:hypothetical protein [Opitutaceae bacterium]
MDESDRLNALLNRWEISPSAQPDFAQQVRARIASPAKNGLIARVLKFPATLPLAASIAIMLGATAAISTDRAERTDQLATAYAQKIDPIHMTSHDGH